MLRGILHCLCGFCVRVFCVACVDSMCILCILRLLRLLRCADSVQRVQKGTESVEETYYPSRARKMTQLMIGESLLLAPAVENLNLGGRKRQQAQSRQNEHHQMAQKHHQEEI